MSTESDKVLLLLGIPDGKKHSMSIKKGKDNKRHLEVAGDRDEDEASAVEAAFLYAESQSKKVTALQILGSNLYHWGRTDILLLRPAKDRFLSYIRDEVISHGKEKEQALREEAGKRGISLKIKSLELDDPVPVVLEEAAKGYDKIFLAKEESHLFPLLSKTMAKHLSKKGFKQVVIC